MSFDVIQIAKTPSTSLYMGLTSLIAWIIPIIGFPVTIIGIGYAIKDITNPVKKNVRIGLWLCVFGLILTAGNSAIGAYKGWKGTYQDIWEDPWRY
ncbi:MAG: hypothetical protein ACK4ND_19725 [Cytophagaceae bacterium]